MSEPNPDLYAEVLLCPMGDNGADAGTIGEYLQVLLETVWIQTDNFSGKRPFGAGSWPYELYEALILNGFVQGVFDEDGYLDEFTEEEMEKADDLIIQAIDYAFKPWRLETEEGEDEEEEEVAEDEDEEAESEEEEEELEEHAGNNGFAARDTITMVELTEEPILLLADDEDIDDDSVQVVAFVDAPDDEGWPEDTEVTFDAHVAQAEEIFNAPPTGIRDTDLPVPDLVPEDWTVTSVPESPSQPMTEDQGPEDSAAPELQPQTHLTQNTPQQTARETE